nr:sulfonate ABC transporter substrate-binding protein [Pantoea sp. 1.19]
MTSLRFTALFATLLLTSISLVKAAEPAPDSLRIGYQKGSVAMLLTKAHRLLEKRYPQTQISWIEFPAGPQLLEALNVGSVDLGGTGDIPPLFAQAAGADLLYVGAEPAKPKAEVILVPEASPIRNVADLKGRKVAFQKGSSSHNLVLRALQQAGLSFSDIQPVYLTPADARAAFQQHSVDAWAIWDPFYSAAVLQGDARVLIDGSRLNLTGSFYLATRDYTEKNAPFLRAVLDTFTEAETLTRTQKDASIALISQAIGLPVPVIARYLANRPEMTIGLVSDSTASAQQHTADLFFASHLLPVKLDIRQRIWAGPAAH